MRDANPPPVMVAPFRLDALEEMGVPRVLGRSTAASVRQPPRPRRRRLRRRRLLVLLTTLGAFALAILAVVRISAPNPVAVVTATLRPSVRVASPPVALPWPAAGQSAISVPALGIDVTSGSEAAVPIASLTKLMTAYIILHDHPLGAGQDGPRLTMTETDVDYFDTDTVQDQANAQVTVGEVLTERQLLGGLLVHSANNYAETLARWDAGSVTAFVAKMNRTAAALGMDHTHYADPSGFDQASQSTAGDLLKVATPDMENATFAAMVKMQSITLPVAGTIATYTPLLGFDGVIGVKSGYTTAAGGCDVVAVVRQVDGRPVLILSAVTGQTGPNVLVKAGMIALNLANHVSTSIAPIPVVHAGEVVAHVTVAGKTVAAAVKSTADLLSWPGIEVTRALVHTRAITAGTKRGSTVGSLVVTVGTGRVTIPVVLRQHAPAPTLLQRLF